MERKRNTSPYQCQRIDCSSFLSPGERGSGWRSHMLRYGQHDGRTLPKQAGHFPFREPPALVGTDLWPRNITPHLAVSPAPPGGRQRVGRRSLSFRGIFGRVDLEAESLRGPLQEMGDTTGGPVCLQDLCQASSLPRERSSYEGRGTRRFHRELEQVGVYLPVSSPMHKHTSESDAPSEVLQGQNNDDCAVVASSAMVRGASPVVSVSSSTGRSRPQRDTPWQALFHTGASRVEFLRACLRHRFSSKVVEDMLSAFRASTVRQYESHWRSFHSFTRERNMEVTEAAVMDFLSFLSHKRGRSASTIATHLAALADPLKYGWGIVLDPRSVQLLKRGLFHQNPPPRRENPFWSLEKVLTLLSSSKYQDNPSDLDLMKRTVFLMALASGFRSSQLRALTRFPRYTTFAADGSAVSIAASPKSLAKNERLDHRLQPVVIPAWNQRHGPHPLCPVSALKEYMSSSTAVDRHHLFCDPSSGLPLSSRKIADLLRAVIEEGDPGRAPRAHDVRSVAASLAFLRTHSLERVREGGQWSTASCFVSRYLSLSVDNTPCVALGLPPDGPQQQND